jgi:signal transduction histidine kinase
MRVRKKLIVLHTVFSALLAAILLITIRPAMLELLERAEASQSRIVLDALLKDPSRSSVEDLATGARILAPKATVLRGSAAELGLSERAVGVAIATPGRAVTSESTILGPCAVAFVPEGGQQVYLALASPVEGAAEAIGRLYLVLVVALLAVYALVAIALEALVLPQNVYGPIRRLLSADQAVQEGRRADELIPSDAIPADELGEIMRSRNEVIEKLRAQERDLAAALAELARVADDLQRKNHMLEAAKRNLADAERLASLGMMSAGIAHELNTPLAVLKGMVERLDADPRAGLAPAQSALMVRVVGRLERLGESLLDFARVGPLRFSSTNMKPVVDEAITLVRLDREASEIEIANLVPDGFVVRCDGDRMVQVFVNLLRNAVDAMRRPGTRAGEGPGAGLAATTERTIRVEADRSSRDGTPWAHLRVVDTGPGIDPAILPTVFEPFTTTRLDARGTGLGLAVSDGIAREHGGLILARNRTDRSGAVFELMLPLEPAESAPNRDDATTIAQRHRTGPA